MTDPRVMSASAASLAAGVRVPTGAPVQLQVGTNRYRITLHWGDFNALFTHRASGARGKQERMMALGFYYGALDGDMGPISRSCWSYMRSQWVHELGHSLSDAQMETRLRSQMDTIVQRDDGSHQAQSDPTQAARIIYPGSFCFTDENDLGNPLTAHRKNAEDRAWRNNTGMGKIPLLVDVVDAATGRPASGVQICFEFEQTHNPILDQVAYLTGISGHTEGSRAPRTYISGILQRARSGPFGYNCVTSKGGLRPSDVNGTLIASGRVSGFPHEVSTTNRPNAYSMVGTSNSEGQCGCVLLLPRSAGDCFKLKAYVIRSNGSTPNAQELAHTGVLTIWRNLRVSKILIKPPSGAFAGSPPLEASMRGALGTIHTNTMRQEFAKHFHDLCIDKDAHTPVTLTESSYQAALTAAIANVNNPANYDIQALVNTGFRSPYLFWLNDDTTYNANRSAGTDALNLSNANTWTSHIQQILDGLIDGFMKHFTKNGLPGVAVVRTEVGDSYSYWAHPNHPQQVNASGRVTWSWTGTTSGVATKLRGCFVWYPKSVYTSGMPYPVTINTMHEMGHVLYLRHHYTSEGTPPTGGFSANHDSQDHCIMGYLPLTTNDFCGKCSLKLRGWDESTF